MADHGIDIAFDWNHHNKSMQGFRDHSYRQSILLFVLLVIIRKTTKNKAESYVLTWGKRRRSAKCPSLFFRAQHLHGLTHRL